MSRPLRIEYPGALYHLTARGNRQDEIFLGDEDRSVFLTLLGEEVEQQQWLCYAYCLMDNHYHLLVETPEANLVKGMRRLNGRYTQRFNLRHGRVGHVFQGRYKSIVVDKGTYLLELSRYIPLNPVRAGMVKAPADYVWSSYRRTVGLEASPSWLATGLLLNHFDGVSHYERFVAEGMESVSPWDEVQGQIWLGNGEFREEMQKRVPQSGVANVPKSQLQPLRPDASSVLHMVATFCACDEHDILSRSNRLVYMLGVYLLRKMANLPLADVAEMCGVSSPRISQIQSEVQGGPLMESANQILADYKLKN
ncbi:transposase [Mariprofundus erugo]|uniref:transposase n=1 Tax=Mariprofundus erugo TaxID=2528639 RepID=UPI0010FD70CF|nr:transposase [Mariprofundus erugo]TLS77970.1 transposase [Mariprofundus erugo]